MYLEQWAINPHCHTNTATKDTTFVSYCILRAMLMLKTLVFHVGPLTDTFNTRLDVLLCAQSVIHLDKHTKTMKDQHGHENITHATTVNNSDET